MFLVKRTSDDSKSSKSTTNSQCSPPKKMKLIIEPLRIGPVSTSEEIDIKVIKFQQIKIKQRLQTNQRLQEEMEERIQKLEARRIQDETIRNVIDKHWYQLNENIRVCLQRFEVETCDESEKASECKATASFLMHLSTWDREKMNTELFSQIQISTTAIAKIMQIFNRLQQNKMINHEGGVTTLKEALVDIQLVQNNLKLQATNISLHEGYRIVALNNKKLAYKFSSTVIKCDELNNQIEGLHYEVSKLETRNENLVTRIQEFYMKFEVLHLQMSSTEKSKNFEFEMDMSAKKIISLQTDNKVLKELANNRLIELETLHQKHIETLEELENLRNSQTSETQIMETTIYKCVQVDYERIYCEANNWRAILQEARQTALQKKSQQLMYDEANFTTVVELTAIKKLQAEKLKLQDKITKDMEQFKMLLVKYFDDLLPKMRAHIQLVTSLVNNSEECKEDIRTYDTKCNELQKETLKFLENDNCRKRHSDFVEEAHTSSSFHVTQKHSTPSFTLISFEGGCDTIGDLRLQLKKAFSHKLDTKLLLNMFKTSSLYDHDRVQLMTSEKKHRLEIEILKLTVREFEEYAESNPKRLTHDDAVNRIRVLEEQVNFLKLRVSGLNQKHKVLRSEMEVTDQALHEIQEQTLILKPQQLMEKNYTNYDLTCQRIKSEHIEQVIRKEIKYLNEQTIHMLDQLKARDQVVQLLQEKEKLICSSICSLEQEYQRNLLASEHYKREVIAYTRCKYDTEHDLQIYKNEFKNIQKTIIQKTDAFADEEFKTKRLQEEIDLLKLEEERLDKIESLGNFNDVLMEELREYKEHLTCPSCKLKQKDAVLTKCFHVFCFDCLQTRYEMRQRKCPTCNAAFGRNDYHRLYMK